MFGIKAGSSVSHKVRVASLLASLLARKELFSANNIKLFYEKPIPKLFTSMPIPVYESPVPKDIWTSHQAVYHYLLYTVYSTMYPVRRLSVHIYGRLRDVPSKLVVDLRKSDVWDVAYYMEKDEERFPTIYESAREEFADIMLHVGRHTSVNYIIVSSGGSTSMMNWMAFYATRPRTLFKHLNYTIHHEADFGDHLEVKDVCRSLKGVGMVAVEEAFYKLLPSLPDIAKQHGVLVSISAEELFIVSDRLESMQKFVTELLNQLLAMVKKQ